MLTELFVLNTCAEEIKAFMVHFVHLQFQPIYHVFLFIASQDKTSRKPITSPASSNPEPRKDSLPLGTAVNESSLLLEVRNHMTHLCLSV